MELTIVSVKTYEYIWLVRESEKGSDKFWPFKNPNQPGPCVCKYDTNIGAHLNLKFGVCWHIWPTSVSVFKSHLFFKQTKVFVWIFY